MISILLSLALAAVTADAAPSDAAPAAPLTQQTAKPAKPKKVCQKIQMSGSNVPKRVCRTVDPAPVEAKADDSASDKPATGNTN